MGGAARGRLARRESAEMPAKESTTLDIGYARSGWIHLHRERRQRKTSPDLLFAAGVDRGVGRVGIAQVDRDGVARPGQLQRRHLGVSHRGKVAAAAQVRRELDEEEAQLGQLELGTPVRDHRGEEAGVLVRRPGVVLSLVPADQRLSTPCPSTTMW